MAALLESSVDFSRRALRWFWETVALDIALLVEAMSIVVKVMTITAPDMGLVSPGGQEHPISEDSRTIKTLTWIKGSTMQCRDS